ncbi:hypothetical protein [Sutcliffiella horikoshii]|uniref:hypothetical protein n=1 Tax=Sutcliffiella horikoshii TaxID=79883 RepID=UPI001F1EFB8F|nr:hypothetical protein [Sutcliffiella horikoshii]MCG1022854.1 hypothetical protein [Sutcliffiella horikoshii]
MKLIQHSFYVILKLLAVSGFAILFYVMMTDKTSNAPMFMLSLMTSLSLIAIPGMKNIINTHEESHHES